MRKLSILFVSIFMLSLFAGCATEYNYTEERAVAIAQWLQKRKYSHFCCGARYYSEYYIMRDNVRILNQVMDRSYNTKLVTTPEQARTWLCDMFAKTLPYHRMDSVYYANMLIDGYGPFLNREKTKERLIENEDESFRSYIRHLSKHL